MFNPINRKTKIAVSENKGNLIPLHSVERTYYGELAGFTSTKDPIASSVALLYYSDISSPTLLNNHFSTKTRWHYVGHYVSVAEFLSKESSFLLRTKGTGRRIKGNLNKFVIKVVIGLLTHGTFPFLIFFSKFGQLLCSAAF